MRVKSGEDPVSTATVSVLLHGEVLLRGSTDSTGAARIGSVPGGTYQIKVEAIGYRTKVIDDVKLDPGTVRALEVQVEVAPVELESIEVRASQIKIQKQNTEFATTVDEEAIKLLPMAQDSRRLIALTPGARPDYVWGGSNFQANSYRIDGLAANHPGMGGDMIEPNIDWIERLDVRGLGAGAEYGGFQGGLVDVTTKSGTNDFHASMRVNGEDQAVNATNLVDTETGTELTNRVDVAGEVRGPIVRDRLFYYLSGERVEQGARTLNHLPGIDAQYSPLTQRRADDKYFGKLTWTPIAAHQFALSGGYLATHTDNYDITGYEGAGASNVYRSPTWFANASWSWLMASWADFQIKANHFQRDEREIPSLGQDVPGLRLYSLTPPYTSFRNAPFSTRSAPASTSANMTTTFRVNVGGQQQVLKVGADYTRGSFLKRRIRNGGMTWMPVNTAGFDPEDPATWKFSSTSFVATEWGGEVHLDADVANTAVFAQSALAFGKHLTLSPGIRWGQWQGWLTPQQGARFLAVQDAAFDPRIGATLDLTGHGTFVIKAHWGRYHQDMISQMFDRAAASDVFSNQDIWYYHGTPPTDPSTAFTQQQRDSLAAQGLFTQESVITLNETGPTQNYRQPYIDEWLLAIEKEISPWVKFEAVYTRRDNRNMIALVDLNRATNYVEYDNVRVYDATGNPLPFSGGTVWLKKLFVPTNAIIDRLKYCARDPNACDGGGLTLPDFTAADTLNLSWNPQYVLTNAPDAVRRFGQLQLNLEVARPTWGGSFSVTFTALKGNLDNVSGYADPQQFGAGQYVHVNEGTDAFGWLPNFAEREIKVSVWGMTLWNVRGGLFFTFSSGDHYSPQFRLAAT
ncbi:MAG: TonB-dependent receptor, partial [Gemmatimonadota bacterium]